MDKAHKLNSYSEAFKTRDIRYYPTAFELEKAQKTWGFKFPHVRPDSVNVAAIGINWSKGAWQKVVDMVEFTNKRGICCWLSEMPDVKVTIPFQTLETMRDAACMHTMDMGFEWMLMIENDALPEEDFLIRLLTPSFPIIVPRIVDTNLNVPICHPQYEKDTGIRPVTWACFTAMLIWTKVLNCFEMGRPFHNTLAEGDFFNKLTHFGHRVYQDTGTELKIAKNPSYHGMKESLDDLWQFWREKDKERRQPIDRKPIDTTDKREVYYP